MKEEGIWTEYRGFRAWCTSAHLVPDKEVQLRRAFEREEDARRQRQALAPSD